MSSKIRSAAIVLVLVNLFATTAYALPPLGRQASPQPRGVLNAAWEWIAELLAPAIQVVWEKAGSSMDPNGDPHAVSGEETDGGSLVAPNGN